MQPPPIDPWFAGFIGTLASASLAIWFVLAWRRPILSYEPRSPVPWNFVAPLVILLLVLLRVSSVVAGQEPPQPDELAGPLEMGNEILLGAATQVAMFGSLFAAVVLLSGATQRDVGLPEFADQFGRDLKIGAITWLAALLPVYGLQGLLAEAVGEKSSHPLIEMVQKEPTAPLMFVAFMAAVVVAPICEELAFRLLLQGWLEKLEDQWLGWRTAVPPQSDAPSSAATDGAAPAPIQETAATGSAVALDQSGQPPRRGLAGLPYGWTPILVSSLLFALAHLGHGPDPVALFLLAIMLGYIYQRSHDVIPSIVTHMLFNLTTLAMLAFAAARGAGAE
jgi:membrane protease YdiL (CAAX protease family)